MTDYEIFNEMTDYEIQSIIIQRISYELKKIHENNLNRKLSEVNKK